MKIFQKRPLVLVISVYFALLITFSEFIKKEATVGIYVSAVIFVCLLAVFITLSLLKRRKLAANFFTATLLSLSLLLSLCHSYTVTDGTYKKYTENYTGECELNMTVTDASYYESYHVYTALIESDGIFEKGVKCRITDTSLLLVSEGDKIRVKGVFSPIEYASCYDYGFSERLYLSFDYDPEVSEIEITGKSEFIAFLSGITEYVKITCLSFLDKDSASLSYALLSADRSLISDTVKNGFSILGISHLLAVSGLHVSVVAAIILFFADKLRINSLVKSILLLVTVGFFALICGLSASVMRALGMLVIFRISMHSGRKYDPITSLFASVFIIVFISPVSAFDISLILSFCSVLGILLLGAPVSSALSFGIRKALPNHPAVASAATFILSSVFISLSAVFASLIPSFFFFRYVSPLSFISNLIFIPITEIILFLSVILLALSFLPVLPIALGGVISLISDPLFVAAEIFSQKQYLLISLRSHLAFVLIVIATLITLILVPRVKKLSLRSFIPAICLFIILGILSPIEAKRLDSRKSISLLYTENASVILVTEGQSSALIILDSDTESLRLALENLRSEPLDINAAMLLSDSPKSISSLVYITRTRKSSLDLVALPSEGQDRLSSVADYLDTESKAELFTHISPSISFGSFEIETVSRKSDDNKAYSPLVVITVSEKKILIARGDALRIPSLLEYTEYLDCDSVIILDSARLPFDKENTVYAEKKDYFVSVFEKAEK